MRISPQPCAEQSYEKLQGPGDPRFGTAVDAKIGGCAEGLFGKKEDKKSKEYLISHEVQ